MQNATVLPHLADFILEDSKFPLAKKMSTLKEKSPPLNLQFVCDKEVCNLLERLIDSVVVEVTANRSTLQPQQVSIGSAEAKADWQYIVELEETIEKMNVELSQSHTKICELDVKVREQEKVLSSAQEEISNLREENARLARDLKEIMASNDGALNINSLPDEMLINIFSLLSHNKLGQIARVCRRWNVLTKNPVLWKEVNVEFDKIYKSQNAVTKCFIKMLPPCVTRIRLDFKCFRLWTEQLNFKEFCMELQRCPRLEMLMLKDAALSDSLLMVIDLCCQFLQDLKILILNRSTFRGHPEKREICGTSKIEVLDLSRSWLGHFKTFPFLKMPHLEQLRLSNTTVGDSWFEDTSFLKQLHVLDVGNTYIGFRTFQAIRNHGLNLKQLYMCETKLRDTDLNFNNSAFPQLETICLLRCDYVTCEGVVSLIQTCQSLQNVYVHKDVAVTYAAHPFIVANRCKLEIVKYISDCDEHRRDNY